MTRPRRIIAVEVDSHLYESVFGNRHLPRSGAKKEARGETSGTIGTPARVGDAADPDQTSGYLLDAPSVRESSLNTL